MLGEPLGELFLRVVVRHRGDDDHVVAGLPVDRRGDRLFFRQLHGIDDPQDFVEIAARGHRIGDRQADFLVRADHEHGADRLVVAGGAAGASPCSRARSCRPA